MSEQEKNNTEVSAEVVEAGNEFPAGDSAGKLLDMEEINAWRKAHPNCKIAFFVHVSDPYVYRSFTTRDMKLFTTERKNVEERLKHQLTDDEFLAMFLNAYVLKPDKCGDKFADGLMAAGIPHLLYDLINHLSGFADVEPMIL